MIRFLTDENFSGKVVRGLRRRNPDIDIVRVQDTIVYQAADPEVLEWAAQQGRILLTHDIDTMSAYANERVASGLQMPGVILIRDTLAIGKVIEDLLTVFGASDASDWENVVTYLPL